MPLQSVQVMRLDEALARAGEVLTPPLRRLKAMTSWDRAIIVSAGVILVDLAIGLPRELVGAAILVILVDIFSYPFRGG